MNTETRFSLCLLLAFALSQAGCGDSPPAASPEPLTLAIPRSANSALVIIAAEQGLFRAAGLDVTLAPTDFGGEAMALLQAGQADGAVASDAVFVISALKSADSDLRFIATIDQVDSTRCVVRTDRGIRAPADLRGKRVGYAAGTASEFYTDLFLNLNGLTRDQVTRLPLTVEQIRTVFTDDRADAVVIWNTYAQELAAGPVPTLAWPAQGEYPMLMGVAVRRVLVEQRPATLVQLVVALIAAEERVRGDPEGAQEAVAEWTGLSLDAVRATWEDNDFTVTLNRSLMLGLEETARWLIQQGRTATADMPNFLDFIAFGPLESARPESASIIR